MRRVSFSLDVPKGVQKEEPDAAIAVRERLKMYCHMQSIPRPEIEEMRRLLNERKEELERRRRVKKRRELVERLEKRNTED